MNGFSFDEFIAEGELSKYVIFLFVICKKDLILKGLCFSNEFIKAKTIQIIF